MSAAISSIGSNMASFIKPESLEPPGRDTKNDHDNDDLAAGAANAAPKPTVNTQGQALGAILNTKA